jgi:hypothetical protein
VELSLGLGGFAAASPAHDAVDGETDENHDAEDREVDGWTGVCGETRVAHATSRRSVASQPAVEAAAA